MADTDEQKRKSTLGIMENVLAPEAEAYQPSCALSRFTNRFSVFQGVLKAVHGRVPPEPGKADL